jgi:hypothetical protein
MEKWEYKILPLQTEESKLIFKLQDFNSQLTKMGDEGWELVNITQFNTRNIHAIFKRKTPL